jgi:hypothetical protein
MDIMRSRNAFILKVIIIGQYLPILLSRTPGKRKDLVNSVIGEVIAKILTYKAGGAGDDDLII